MSDKLAKLQEIMRLVNEGITRDDFLTAFKEVLRLVNDIKGSNEQEWSAIHDAMKKIPDRMMSEMMLSMTKTEKKMVKDCMDKCETMCAEMEQKHKEEMGKMDLEVRMIKADREAIIEDTLAKIPEEVEETPQQVRNKLETLKGKERLPIDAIDGLTEKLEEVSKIKGQVQFVPNGSSGGGIVKAYDLTSQLNGVLKTFSLPAFWRVISVHSSSVPNAFRPTTDFTTDASAMTITFTDEINASSTLNTGQTLLVVYAEP